jgi:hypothetical protein
LQPSGKHFHKYWKFNALFPTIISCNLQVIKVRNLHIS